MMEDRINYFFEKLVDIIDSCTTPNKEKIEALKVYSTLLPTMKHEEVTINHKVPTIDTSSLSDDEKKVMVKMLDKLEKKNDKSTSS